jgi:hypothetical protein
MPSTLLVTLSPMAFDLILTPPSGFLDWTEVQWDEFFERDPYPDLFQLGRSVSVGLVLESVSHNLENDKAGSKYPLLMRIEKDEKVGWYQHEIETLRIEVEEIRSRFAALPINRSTLKYDNDEDVQQRIADFITYYPNRPIQNLYHLYAYFLDGMSEWIQKAIQTGQGLVVIY